MLNLLREINVMGKKRTPDLSGKENTKKWLQDNPKVFLLVKEILEFCEPYRNPDFEYGWYNNNIFKFGRDSVGPRLGISCNLKECVVVATLLNKQNILDKLGFEQCQRKPELSRLTLKFKVGVDNKNNYRRLMEVIATNLLTPLSCNSEVNFSKESKILLTSFINKIAQAKGFSKTEKDSLIKARIGQGRYRAALDDIWKGCALTGIKCRDLLRASHIKAWRDAEDSERTDPFNGLLLSAHLDALFDRGLISFDSEGFIMIADSISESDLNKLSIDKSMQLNIPQETHEYMKYHREKYNFEC